MAQCLNINKPGYLIFRLRTLTFDYLKLTQHINTQKPGPIVVVEGTVFVATIGATVAAATGVTGLKIGFCGEQI